MNQQQRASMGDVVEINYVGRRQNGSVFATSQHRGPLRIKLGQGQVIEGVERAVEGMCPGGVRTIRLGPQESFGSRRPELVFRVPLEQLPGGESPQVGQRLQLRSADERIFPATVTGVTESEAILDANHHLAGQTVSFEIRLVSIL